jgi:hypothetical protein
VDGGKVRFIQVVEALEAAVERRRLARRGEVNVLLEECVSRVSREPPKLLLRFVGGDDPELLQEHAGCPCTTDQIFEEERMSSTIILY